ncbi:hypothetical protein GGR53DRAFT_469225 [Hypoxylon sp. FL1150]|nr:hypothetical protein GGR53DRAFT_469225 [Hypoxylon sp. FL1150]
MKRLRHSNVEVNHPILLPGIFAELERDQHIIIVEKYMDDLEAKMFERDYQPSIEQRIHVSSSENRKGGERSKWFDTAYLRDSLITWNAKLSKMPNHIDELREKRIKPSEDLLMGNYDFQYADYGNETAPSMLVNRISM